MYCDIIQIEREIMRKILIAIISIILIIFIFFKDDDYKINDIKIAGSSTVYPITLEAEYKYMENNPDIRINVESNGTGGGLDLFVKSQISIADASRAIKEEEIKKAQENGVEYYELMLGSDGITVIVNPENYWIDDITLEDLNKIFAADEQVELWSDINPDFPEEEIHLYGPTSASGTYDFFCETVVQTDPCGLTNNMNATENDNEIVSNIQKDKYGIGFLGYAYYQENSNVVKSLSVDGVSVNEKTIKSGEYEISRPLYIYVNKEDMENNEDLNDFVNYYVDNSQEFTSLAGYVPLSDDELKIEQEKLKAEGSNE